MKDNKNNSFTKTNRANDYNFSLKVYFFLLVASLLASLAIIPYSSALLFQETLAPPKSVMLKAELSNFVILTMPLSTIGLLLSPKVRLGAPHIRAILTKAPRSYRGLQSSVVLGVIWGIICGIFVYVIDIIVTPFFPPELKEIELPGVFPALLASFSAGVNEEIWFRLGIMTCLVWLGSKLMRQTKPNKMLILSANLLAALAFGALHLPQVSVLAKGLTLWLLVSVLGLNGIVGLVFGWLYWQYGLLSAMVAHFVTDIVIHVIPALLVNLS